jgi:cytidylate kinase
VHRSISIAIDGPASSGKGTVARKVAQALGYAYIDTGAMYRIVALMAARRGVEFTDAKALAVLTDGLLFAFSWAEGALQVRVDGEDVTEAIRLESVGKGASDVSVHKGVRRALVARQRAMAIQGGVVMDGRDIGSVVLPDAALKIYLDASVDVRAERRHKELSSRGLVVDFATVRCEIERRDKQDKERAEAPLIQAEDAVFLDTTRLDPDAAARTIIEMAHNQA